MCGYISVEQVERVKEVEEVECLQLNLLPPLHLLNRHRKASTTQEYNFVKI